MAASSLGGQAGLIVQLVPYNISALIPEPLQVIKGAILAMENVHQNIAEILDNPSRCGVPLGACGKDAPLPHFLVQRVGQRLHLGRIAPADL